MLKKKRICKINVTNMPMESVADKIIKMLGERFGDIFDDPHAPSSRILRGETGGLMPLFTINGAHVHVFVAVRVLCNALPPPQ